MLTYEICCNCEYYEGVTGVMGCAPCKRQHKMVLWNESCEKIWLISEKLAYGNPTNADRIRSMSDEELAGKFEEIQLQAAKAYGNDDMLLAGELREYWLGWLKHEAKEE